MTLHFCNLNWIQISLNWIQIPRRPRFKDPNLNLRIYLDLAFDLFAFCISLGCKPMLVSFGFLVRFRSKSKSKNQTQWVYMDLKPTTNWTHLLYIDIDLALKWNLVGFHGFDFKLGQELDLTSFKDFITRSSF